MGRGSSRERPLGQKLFKDLRLSAISLKRNCRLRGGAGVEGRMGTERLTRRARGFRVAQLAGFRVTPSPPEIEPKPRALDFN